MTVYDGNSGDFVVDDTAYLVSGWKASAEVTDLNCNTVASGGYHENVGGIKKLNVELTIPMNDSTAEIEVNTVLEDVELFLADSGKKYDIPFLRVMTVDVDHQVDSVTKLTAKCVSNGSFTSYTTPAGP